ncbi:N-acetylmuramoyl-L-alanine amidase [Enhygromyxa salina]|uniref:N-acetylmuramoyl-L-alanine amidase n=1 Tax=Enhygromyxa salina TaxID=215803 RepID=A0A2S9XUP1_9BACT|nr:N-acetylmuramoyl-L-alanine amidase [Enhygromyxa salina]PRP96572.1 N-acetylmuramoyl-L-alanine amidase [Enhygromyxa salina]
MTARPTTEYIIWHTAAHPGNLDTSAAQIDGWHKHNGWSGIGYHYVVRQGGAVESGRAAGEVGAHAKGLNGKSIGICFSGDGDEEDFTVAQREAGLELTRRLMDEYEIPAEKVLGHREINTLVDQGVVAAAYRTSKSCPGAKVDMDDVRRQLAACRFALPVDLGHGVEVTDEALAGYYDHSEKQHPGGYFPLGANTVWHGGLHLRGERGATVIGACADGELVAARMFETDADGQGHGHYGSVNFILLRHVASATQLRQANRKPVETYRVRISTLNFRPQPGRSATHGHLHVGDLLRRRAGEPDVDKGGYAWIPLEVVGSTDATWLGKQGYAAYDPSWLEAVGATDELFADGKPWTWYSLYMHLDPRPLAKRHPGLERLRWIAAGREGLAEELAKGGVVRVSDETAPVSVEAGEPLWLMGEYGSPNYRAGLIHWEVFAGEALMPSWACVEDTDEDYNMDAAQILELVEQDWFGSDAILTHDEIREFYANNARAKELRRYGCRFVSEWGINLDKAIAALRRQAVWWRTASLKQRISPLLWWDEAVAAGVELPEDRKVWHYNPVEFVSVMGGTRPVTAAEAAAPAPDSECVVLVVRDGSSVPHFCQGDQAWGARTLGSSSSIEAKGCAITAVAMVLAYYGRDINPKQLDEHLDAKGGYMGNAVYWAKALSAGASADLPTLTVTTAKMTNRSQFASTINARIDANMPTIAEVDYGKDSDSAGDHFVVIVGRNEAGQFIMNDPGTRAGNGAANPSAANVIETTTRDGGMTIVRLMLFDVS